MKKLIISTLFICIYFTSCNDISNSELLKPIIITHKYSANDKYLCKFYVNSNQSLDDIHNFYDSCNKHEVGDTIQFTSTHK